MLAADSECNYLNELPPGRHWSDPGVRKDQDDKPFPALQNRVPLYLRQRGKLPAAKTSVKVEQWKFTPTGFFGSGEYRYPILLDSTRVDIEGGEKCFRMEPMDGSGVRFFRFVPEGNWPQNMSPEHFANMVFQEYYAVLRVLPYKDYSHISDEDLTFELIYREIFRYYHLILPAMSQRLDMSDPSIWKTPTAAMYILRMADERIWNSCDYMPRTRDLSQCRQQLLHRFCKKVLREHGQQGRIDASVENASAKGA
jgi:hypothetical protein